MIWQTWRQHRGEALGATLTVVAFGVLALWHGVPMRRAYDRDGIEACQLVEPPDEQCGRVLDSFRDSFASLPDQVATWLPFLPLVAGILIGAPLLAREFEQGTWQLAWTQSVTKSRWLLSTFALVLGGATAASVALAAVISWWFEPVAPHAFTPEKFNHGLLVFPSYVLLAIGIGIAAGAVLRRTIPAAAITLVGFLAVRLPVEFALRPRYRQPLTTTDPAEARGWIVDESGGPAGGVLSTASGGTNQSLHFHPDDRFWQFQLIEAAICAGVATVAILFAYHHVRSGDVARVRVRRERDVGPIADRPGLHAA